jgi:hypothetical protein
VAAALVVAALVTPRLAAIAASRDTLDVVAATTAAPLLPLFPSLRWAFLMPWVTPEWFPALVLAGSAALVAAGAWRPLAAVLAIGLGHAALTSGMFTNLPFLQRTQTFSLPFLAIAAAGAPDFAARLACRAVAFARSRPVGARAVDAAATAAAVAVALLAAGTAADWADRIREPTEASQEWDFVRESVPALPPGHHTLLVLGRPGPAALDPFPVAYLARIRPDCDVHDLSGVRSSADLPPPAPGMLFYQGMYCHIASPSGQDPSDPLHPICRAVVDRYRLRPLRTTRVDGAASSAVRYAHDGLEPFEIGFYEILGEAE